MQCIHMRDIYTIDKDFIKQSPDNLPKGMMNKISKYGNGSFDKGVDEYFTGKEWVSFGGHPVKGEQRALWEKGYYKHNKVPCGTCEICRIDKSKSWAVKAAAERKVWENSCFLTLTYKPDDPVFIATGGTLNKATMQAFWKKLRYHLYKETKEAAEINLKEELENMQEIPEEIKIKYMMSNRKPTKKPIRYIQANEYGEKKGRCHHHAILFNFIPSDLKKFRKDKRGYWLYTSEKISKIWGHGHVIIGRATTNAAAYVGRYCTKKHSKMSKDVNDNYTQIAKALKEIKYISDKIKDGNERVERLTNELKIWKTKKESICASSLGYIGSYYWETHKDEVKRNGGILVAWNKGVRLEKVPKIMEKQWKEEDPETYELYEFNKEENGKKQWEEILSKTDMTEEEYIKSTYEKRMKQIQLLKREYDNKPLAVV